MTPLEGDLVSLVKRLVRCLPTDHITRIEALDFLTKHGLISPLRQIEVVEPKVKLGKLPEFNFYHGWAEFAPPAPEGINYAFKAPADAVASFLEPLKALVIKRLEQGCAPIGVTDCKLPFFLSDWPKRLLAAPDYSNEEMEHLAFLGWNPVRRHMNSYVLRGQNMVLAGRKVPMVDEHEGVNKALIA